MEKTNISEGDLPTRTGHKGSQHRGQPLVSIITPTYNHEKFIGECIESVLAQTYQNWEQIIIDDGSTDKTTEIVAQYQDKRITYVKQENVGIWRLGETYNRALDISQGELIAILEGDDFWPPNKLEKQVPAFIRPEVVLSWGRGIMTNSIGKPLCTTYDNLNQFKHRTREELMRILLFHNFISPCTTMCRKNALVSIGGFQQPKQVPYVDYPTWLKLSLIGEFEPMDDVLVFRRRHENQVSAVMKIEMAKAHNRCSMVFFQDLPQSIKDSMNLGMLELNKSYEDCIANTYCVIGRENLFRHRWLDARKNFSYAFRKGNRYIKAKALSGIICSYLRVDMEWAAILMRKPKLRDLF